MSTIIGITGSLPTGSFNTAVLRACAELAGSDGLRLSRPSTQLDAGHSQERDRLTYAPARRHSSGLRRQARGAFDDGGLIDETVKKLASELMDRFADFVASKTSRELRR